MKHIAHRLITVWTEFILSVTRLRRYTKITVWVFTVRKFSLEFLKVVLLTGLSLVYNFLYATVIVLLIGFICARLLLEF